MNTPIYHVRRHSPDCGCEGLVSSCRYTALVSVPVTELDGDDVATLAATEREAALDWLREELVSDPERPGHWLLEPADVEDCPTCCGVGRFVGADEFGTIHSEDCDDCDGQGCYRARPTLLTEAHYELVESVGATSERLIATTRVEDLVVRAEQVTRETVRPMGEVA